MPMVAFSTGAASAPVFEAIVPPEPLLLPPPSPEMVKLPFVFFRKIPLDPVVDETEVNDMPREVSPAGPLTFTAVPLLLSATLLALLLIVPSTFVATRPLAPLVNMLTVPRL